MARKSGVGEEPKNVGGRGKKSDDPATSICGSIKRSERTEIEQLAAGLGISANALVTYFIRYSVIQYKAGKIDVPVTRRVIKTVEMPK